MSWLAAAARAVSSSSSFFNGRRGGGRAHQRGRVTLPPARSGLLDFVGGDLVKPDIGRWLDDVEEHKALAIYPPHEGGYEGRYLNRLKRQGYYFLDLTARGLGDPEATLTKIHPVCPVSQFFFNFFFLPIYTYIFLCKIPVVLTTPGGCLVLHSLASGGSPRRGGTSRRRWTTGSACCSLTPRA
jgi:hypothetical protein